MSDNTIELYSLVLDRILALLKEVTRSEITYVQQVISDFEDVIFSSLTV